jgi:hypothetical protein
MSASKLMRTATGEAGGVAATEATTMMAALPTTTTTTSRKSLPRCMIRLELSYSAPTERHRPGLRTSSARTTRCSCNGPVRPTHNSKCSGNPRSRLVGTPSATPSPRPPASSRSSTMARRPAAWAPCGSTGWSNCPESAESFTGSHARQPLGAFSRTQPHCELTGPTNVRSPSGRARRNCGWRSAPTSSKVRVQ